MFRLTGGTDHYWSFHGPRGAAEASGLQLTAQNGGTLAGPDVPYGQKWNSEWSQQHFHLLTFPFLYDVRRARPVEPWSVRWDLENYPDVHLHLHSLQPAGAEVSLSKGKPPGGGKPYELVWVVQHNSGTEPLDSVFVEVMEAYEGEPVISEVRRLEVSGNKGGQPPVAFQVMCGGRTDTIIHSADPAGTVMTGNGIAMQGSFGVWSEEGGTVKRAFLVGGTRIAKGETEHATAAPAWSGKIVAADFAACKIQVSPAPDEPVKLVGRYARITNEVGSDTTHLIKGAKPVAGGVELVLELDPRIGEGPVGAVHADGVQSAVRLQFGGLYYRGKTLSNEDHSALYKLSGVKDSRAYVSISTDPQATEDGLRRQFADRDGDGTPRFLIYDYGPGDVVTVPSIISISHGGTEG